MPLNTLPPEIVIHIISYLPLSTLLNLNRVSRLWQTFFSQNESTIYRQAAFLHGMIRDASASLDQLEPQTKCSKRVLKDVNNWKDLCQVRFRVRDAWSGFTPSVVVSKPCFLDFGNTVHPLGDRVHRIKVDENRRFILNTTAFDIPRIVVRDMDTGKVLWLLRPTCGRAFAHLEYSEGFLVFDRSTGEREVWRLAESEPDHPVPCSEAPPDFDSKSIPDEAMNRDSKISLAASRDYYSEALPSNFKPRGCFEPYALLRPAEETHAYRLVFPTLLTAARDRVYMWDIPTARVVEVIEGIQSARAREGNTVPSRSAGILGFFSEKIEVEASFSEDQAAESLGLMQDDEDEDAPGGEWEDIDPEDDGDVPPLTIPADVFRLRTIRYVEHSHDHIFLAGQYVLKIFSRATENDSASGRTAPVLELTSTKQRYGRWRYIIKPSRRAEEGSALIRHDFAISEKNFGNEGDAHSLFDVLNAVHVSPCGSHFAVLLSGTRLLIVPHFRQLIGQPENAVYDSILDVQLASPEISKSIYLAYEEGDYGEGRIGIVTTHAVFIVTFPALPVNYPSKTPPRLRVSRVKILMNPDCLQDVSCLMLSDTNLFLNFQQETHDADESMEQWEDLFENSLQELQSDGINCYQKTKDALFVPDLHFRGSLHLDSTVYAVDMLPPGPLSGEIPPLV